MYQFFVSVVKSVQVHTVNSPPAAKTLLVLPFNIYLLYCLLLCLLLLSVVYFLSLLFYALIFIYLLFLFLIKSSEVVPQALNTPETVSSGGHLHPKN